MLNLININRSDIVKSYFYYNQLKLNTHFLNVPYYNNKKRRIRVLLPYGYNDDLNTHYPVIYMHDGQNIFYSKESYSGHSWKVIPTLKHFFKSKVIIVGVDSAGINRLDEYGPWRFDDNSHGGLGFEYAKWFVEEIKPFIDNNYRTLADRENTTLAGSSMGAIISATIGALYPDTFGKLGIFSLASWLFEDNFINFINNHPLNKQSKVYIQVGSNEANSTDKTFSSKNINQAYIDSSLAYYNTLIKTGLDIDNIHFKIFADETHSEVYWAKHFLEFLNFTQ